MRSPLLTCAAWGGVAVTAIASARADVFTMSFEGLQNVESVQSYYAGGLGSLGSGPGPNYGVTFNPASLSIVSTLAGGYGNFSNNPSGHTAMYFSAGFASIMNVPGGFNTGVSFYYSSNFYQGGVYVYDGLDGAGTLLASKSLPVTPMIPNLPGGFNNWGAVGVSFSGTAKSVAFSGMSDSIVFDNISIGTSVPIPEPSGIALAVVGVALASLMAGRERWSRRRRESP